MSALLPADGTPVGSAASDCSAAPPFTWCAPPSPAPISLPPQRCVGAPRAAPTAAIPASATSAAPPVKVSVTNWRFLPPVLHPLCVLHLASPTCSDDRSLRSARAHLPAPFTCQTHPLPACLAPALPAGLCGGMCCSKQYPGTTCKVINGNYYCVFPSGCSANLCLGGGGGTKNQVCKRSADNTCSPTDTKCCAVSDRGGPQLQQFCCGDGHGRAGSGKAEVQRYTHACRHGCETRYAAAAALFPSLNAALAVRCH